MTTRAIPAGISVLPLPRRRGRSLGRFFGGAKARTLRAALGYGLCVLGSSAPSARAEDTWSEPFQGVRYLHRTTTDPKKWDMHLVFIDLTEPANKLITTVQEDRQMTTPQWAEKKKVQVAINGGMGGDHKIPSGVTVGEGRAWTDISTGDKGRRDEFGWFAEGGGRIQYYLPSSDVKPEPWMQTLIVGTAMLLWKGEILPPMADLPVTHEDRKPHLVDPLPASERFKMTDLIRMNPRMPRTGVGTTKDHKTMIFFVVDGRQKHSVGMTGNDMQKIFHEFGAWEALDFDGGGSSCFYIEGLGVLNKPSDGKPRHNANHLGCYAKPGAGKPKGQVKGYVKEAGTGKPVAGAKVAVSGTYFDTTDEKGYFHLSQVPAGSARLAVTAMGFADGKIEVAVEAGKTAEAGLDLTSGGGAGQASDAAN